MQGQDWDRVVVSKTSGGGGGSGVPGNAVHTSAGPFKFGAGKNQQRGMQMNSLKVDEETEELSHKHVERSLCKIIMKARLDKKLSQKELATKINEKPTTIQEYENGKAIPNTQVLVKMERVLGVKLRGKNPGGPPDAPKKKSTTATKKK
eukprot:TRINITY_DN16983_c0_g1_i1.p1 TRINITY_DN16983_c0_g1~~TRINITY_DN16983_c0_g1_i1.p1  ORF type:complete len:149 (-),score=57.36 TRINITY_DN16983_c0_g1_i1:101-547(-)